MRASIRPFSEVLVRFALPVALATAALAGCSSTVAGDVDGEQVPSLFSAFFIQQKADALDHDGNPATRFTVAGTGASVFDGCNAAAAQQENVNAAFKQETKDLKDAGDNADDIKKAHEDFVDAVVDYDKAHLPSDFWSAAVSLAGFEKKKLDGGGADIDFKNPDSTQDFDGAVTICRVNDWPEKKKDRDGVASIKDHQTCFAGVKGTVDVNQYTEDETLEIVGDVDLSRANPSSGVNPDNDDGAATVTISGGWCEGLENALDDFTQLQEDRASP